MMCGDNSDNIHTACVTHITWCCALVWVAIRMMVMMWTSIIARDVGNCSGNVFERYRFCTGMGSPATVLVVVEGSTPVFVPL